MPSISQQPFGNQGVQGVDWYPRATLFVKKHIQKCIWREGDQEIGNEMEQFLLKASWDFAKIDLEPILDDDVCLMLSLFYYGNSAHERIQEFVIKIKKNILL